MSSNKNAVPKKNLNTSAKRSIETKPASTESKKLKPSAESKDNEIEIISISDSDDDDDKKIRAKPTNLEVNYNHDDDDDDDVVVLDADECRKASLVSFAPESAGLGIASLSCGFNDDDEVQAIGGTNQMNLPHMRQHCSVNKFVPDLRIALNVKNSTFVKDSEGNQNFCSLCYCFVCDGPASECKYWKSEGNKFPNNHCLASDRGRDSSYWKQLRQANKHNSSDSSNTSSSDIRFQLLRTIRDNISMMEDIITHHNLDGPFDPKDRRAAQNKSLTKCRKCGWYSKLQGPMSYGNEERDWCLACGRVASEAAFNKSKYRNFEQREGIIWFGQKEIKFRVKARDPRQLIYKKYWSKYEGTSGWVYDKAELEEDFFRHRIGTYPTAHIIAKYISLFDFDDIPTSFPRNSNISTLETEGIFLANQNDRVLFQWLPNTLFEYDIQANWNRARAEGTFRIDLYMAPLDEDATKNSPIAAATNHTLGAWLDVYPLKLSEVTYGIPACELSPRALEKQIQKSYDTIPIKSLSVEEVSKIYEEELAQNKKAVSTYNAEVAKITSEFIFTSSANSSHGGGICDSDNSLRGTLTRYYRESWFEDIASIKCWKFQYRYGGSCFGLKSYFRTLRRTNDCYTNINNDTHIYDKIEMLSYLSHEDFEFVRRNLCKEADLIRKRHEKPSGLLQQLENLGHTSALQPEGLNVNLLDFQQQTVQWALERETAPLGAQRCLWTDIPNVKMKVGNNFVPTQLYYSPIRGRFRRKEPQCIRGGIIAEEMGLGKTLISLSIILKNPAPITPESGSLVRNYSLPAMSQSSSCPWSAVSKLSNSILHDDGEVLDPKLSNLSILSLDSKNENAPIKRASIFSRATLVVCNVSLVGQWIDEAKSKLKNPGLIYCYYGSNRTRDSTILAKNAIVVTTYAVLASDKYNHAKKSNDVNYCSPCEQIFWWRVIVDESHTLRDANTNNFRSLISLRAVNKWCVSGTPIASRIDDVICGLKFLEFENLDPLFSVSKAEPRKDAGLLFLFRQILMRHCNAQRNIKGDKNLIELPPRIEKTVLIAFSSAEKTFYEKIEKKALDFYQEMKNMHRGSKELNRQYLKLHTALTPLRICCSGGTYCGSIADSADSYTATDNCYELRPEDSTICSICLDEMDNACATKCKPLPHIFCRECIEGVLDAMDGSGGDCPICRQRLKSNHLRQAYKRIEIVSNEKKEELNEGNVVFTSKFNRLLSELKSIRDTEPDAKSLVFTQFSSTLKFLKEELPKHGFQLRYLSGDMTMSARAKALRDFQSDPPTTVFLLSTRAGACGINLTHANRVFLMEPAMNPALEQQAIGRVRRLGQKSIVQIIKLCMENSFETRLMKILNEKYGDEKVSDQEENETNDKDDQSSSGDESSDESSIYGYHHSEKQTVKTNLLEDEFDRLFGIE